MSLGPFTYNLLPGDTITNFTWNLHDLVIVGSGSDILEFRLFAPAGTLIPSTFKAIDRVAGFMA